MKQIRNPIYRVIDVNMKQPMGYLTYDTILNSLRGYIHASTCLSVNDLLFTQIYIHIINQTFNYETN